MARVFTAVAVLLALLYAVFSDSLGDVYYLSSGILSACIAVPAIAIFWQRATTPGVLCGSLAGVATTLSMYFWEYRVLLAVEPTDPSHYTNVLPSWLANGCGYLYIGAGVLASAAGLITVSLLTRPSQAECLAAVCPVPVDGTAPLEAVSEEPLTSRDHACAAERKGPEHE